MGCLNLQFRGGIWAGPVSWGVGSIQMVFETMILDKVTKGVDVFKEEVLRSELSDTASFIGWGREWEPAKNMEKKQHDLGKSVVSQKQVKKFACRRRGGNQLCQMLLRQSRWSGGDRSDHWV